MTSTGTGYWQELWRERRALTGAALGTGFSISLNIYIASVFVPSMQAEFGWTRSQISYVGLLTLIGMFSFPLVGRLADRFGSRPVTIAGLIVIPGCFLLYSLQRGSIWEYYAIQGLWSLLAPLWSATVLCRIAAGRLTKARGFGIALLLSAPALVGALAAPLLTEAIAQYGWRTAWRMLAAVVLIAGIIAILLLPSQKVEGAARTDTRPSREAFAQILRSRAFLVLAVAMLLCNLGIVATGIQFAPMLIERGVNAALVGFFLSAYAGGVIAGRFAIGLSLDRLPTRWVAAIGMSLPAIGFALLATIPEVPGVAFIAVMLLGLSQGAEGDIAGYVGAQYIGPQLFSTVYGLVVAVMSLASVIGSAIAGLVLGESGSFTGFLLFLALTTALGAAAFLLLPRHRSVTSDADAPLEVARSTAA